MTKYSFLVLALSVASALLLPGCQSSSNRSGADLPAGVSRPVNAPRGDGFAPGDSIEVYVLEDDTLSGRYLVRPSGHIILPTVGRVSVAGLTPTAAEAAIRHALEGTQLKTATVMVERGSGAKAPVQEGVTVFLSGSIQNPGRKVVAYVSGRKPTLLQSILEAGGFTRFADQRRVSLTRSSSNGRQRPLIIDATAIRRGAAADVSLEDGDIIFVPEKGFGW